MEFVFNSFVTLLVVVDPLGLAPIFAALTRGFSARRKRESAVRGVMIGTAILLLFAFVGDVLLGTLGIGLPAFRIAGGMLLFLLALDMIFARPTGSRARSVQGQDQDDSNEEEDISVFPLAIPLIGGPGAITTVLLYTGGAGPTQLGIFIGVLAFVLLLTLVSLLLAPRVMALFGETGANVLSRVLGVLLAALGVQFVLDGLNATLG